MSVLKSAGAMLLAAGGLALAAGPALALTVTNQSDQAQEITVDLGNDEPKTKIEAGKSANLACPEGCEVRVTGMSYGLSANDGDKVIVGKDLRLSFADGAQAANGAGDKAGKKTKAN
ncbi:hypothetical protein [Hansschlegelia beijingensis]|uniref:DUF5666 domain-containing protein n=1 Tax=Hansschlegelia beijingensis TaxID=1133344 RepID=A0A7W6GG28_9HYPH|nr:hypothetical protein [Hansschlegelia beijingensis]MBB3972259.1 hypothetical protein [Hansschlegelia beijingensis]